MQLLKYGHSNIVVPTRTIPSILIHEVLNPFYFFQIFSMILCFWNGNRYYAACILIVFVASAIFSLIEARTNIKSIREMANFSCPVNVMRNSDENQLEEVDSSTLVPGHVIEIP